MRPRRLTSPRGGGARRCRRSSPPPPRARPPSPGTGSALTATQQQLVAVGVEAHHDVGLGAPGGRRDGGGVLVGRHRRRRPRASAASATRSRPTISDAGAAQDALGARVARDDDAVGARAPPRPRGRRRPPPGGRRSPAGRPGATGARSTTTTAPGPRRPRRATERTVAGIVVPSRRTSTAGGLAHAGGDRRGRGARSAARPTRGAAAPAPRSPRACSRASRRAASLASSTTPSTSSTRIPSGTAANSARARAPAGRSVSRPHRHRGRVGSPLGDAIRDLQPWSAFADRVAHRVPPPRHARRPARASSATSPRLVRREARVERAQALADRETSTTGRPRNAGPATTACDDHPRGLPSP